MKTPSIKTLSRVFKLPGLAKAILQMVHVELAYHPIGEKRIAECHSRPEWYDVRFTILDSIEPNSYGLETVEVRGKFAHYLNMGDSYADTLILFNGNYRVQSIGDFLERNGG